LNPSCGARSIICRITESSKATSKFGDVTATKFLMNPLFSCCTNWPKPEKSKGKKRAAGVPAASVATAVGLGREEGGASPAKRSNSSLLVEVAYAMDALAGDPRANAHCMELHKEDVARRATRCSSAQEQNCAVCAWIVFLKKYALCFTLSSRVLLARRRRPVALSIAAPTRPR
jgi:hypothetical protein